MIDSEHIKELFAAFAPVSVRRMFSGAGVFTEGLMIAIVVDGVIYLKVATQDIAAFEREGCGPFSYATKEGTRSLASYWRMPDRFYDDPDELAQWARRAYAAAQAGRTKQRGVTPRVRSRRASKNTPTRGRSRAG